MTPAALLHSTASTSYDSINLDSDSASTYCIANWKINGVQKAQAYLDFGDDSLFIRTNTAAGPLKFGCNSILQHRIDPLGIFTWYDGAGGTRMTLNSTGLGVGIAPVAYSDKSVTLYGSTTSELHLLTGNTGSLSSDGVSIGITSANELLIFNREAAAIRFGTNNTDVMRIDSSGNVGVGVTPKTTSGAYRTIQNNNAVMMGAASDPGAYWNANCVYNTIWRYIINGRSSRYEQGPGTHAWFYDSGTQTADANCSFVQAMTLDGSGNLHVGTTAHLNTGTNFVNSLNGFNIVPNNTALAANRNWNLAANGGAAGNLDFVISSANNTFPNSAYRMQLTSAGALNNTTGTYGTISDLRLKENISDARNYLADLLKLRVVKYSLKEESSTVATKLGFIAQEVELVFPNLVDQSDKEYDGAEGIRSVKTSILIPMLLKAIQELTARVQTLEAR
jgi:hypothetical protein